MFYGISHRRGVLSLNFNQIYLFLVYFSFLGYIAFLPIGPYPIHLLGVKLDVSFAIGLFLLLIPIAHYMWQVYPKELSLALVGYFFITWFSVVGSSDVELSLREWGVMFGYAMVCFLAPVVVLPQISFLRTFFLTMALIVSLGIIYLYLFTDFGSIRRFALGTDPFVQRYDSDVWVDPNMTATGLAMSILVYIPNLNQLKHSFWKFFIGIVVFLIILSAITITISRSSMLALLLSCFLAMVALSLQGFVKRGTGYFRYSLIVGMLGPILLILVYISFPSILTSLLDRFSQNIGNSVRVFLIDEAFSIYTSSAKNVLLGNGYQTLNPHNEYIRNLTCSGILGFFAFLVLLGNFYLFVVRKVRSDYFSSFSAISLFLFIIIAIIFYGHAKTLWTSLLFILVLYLEQKKVNIEKTKYAHE